MVRLGWVRSIPILNLVCSEFYHGIFLLSMQKNKPKISLFNSGKSRLDGHVKDKRSFREDFTPNTLRERVRKCVCDCVCVCVCMCVFVCVCV